MPKHLYGPDLGHTETSENAYNSTLHLNHLANHATSPGEGNYSLVSPSPYRSTSNIESPTLKGDPHIQGLQIPQTPNPTYGILRRKKHVNETDLLAVIVSLLSFVAAVVTTSPRLVVAWKLGLKRQVSLHYLLLLISGHLLEHILNPPATSYWFPFKHNELVPERRCTEVFSIV